MDNSDRDCNVDPRRLRTALGELAHDLAQAGEKLDVDRRGAWIHAVAAVWLFVDKLDYYDRERRKAPFATLAGALQALDRGTIDPGLQPTERRPGRPPDPPDVALVRSMAAAWMHFLVQAGQDKAAAGRAVARVLNREGVRLGKRSNVSIEQAGRTVEKWRERLEEGSDQTEAVDFYKFIKEKYAHPAGTSADAIMAELPTMLSEPLVGRIRRKSDQPPCCWDHGSSCMPRSSGRGGRLHCEVE